MFKGDTKIEQKENLKEKEIYYQEMFSDYPDVVSVGQLKNMLNIGQVLAYKLVKKGEIKARKIGREYKIPKVNVIIYILKGME